MEQPMLVPSQLLDIMGVSPITVYLAIPVVTCLAYLLFVFVKKQLRTRYYWENLKIPCASEGNYLMQWAKKKKPLQEEEKEWYEKNGNLYGRYEGVTTPVLCVGNTNMLKKILVKDFAVFANRRELGFHDPIMSNTLFFLNDDNWKRVRTVVTPTFTTKKLNKMMPLLAKCCDVLVKRMMDAKEKSGIINCQEFFNSFVLSTIGSCAFGINIKSLEKPNNEFVEKSNKLFYDPWGLKTLLTVHMPWVMRLFRLRLLNSETISFYEDVILNIIEKRKDGVVRDDFLQSILNAEILNNNVEQNENCAIEDCNTKSASKPSNKKLSHDEMVSQCVTFFLAGFDPTSSLLSHALYQFAVNQKHQDLVVEEIEQVMENLNITDRKPTYDSLSEMKVLDAVLSECLRLCPAMVRSERQIEFDYVLKDEEKGISVPVKKGMLISMPVYAMHHDPEFFPDPEEFKPERFLDQNSTIPNFAYLPFGSGPRVCVGQRFVQMQVKLCLASILLKFRIVPAPDTPEKLKYVESRNILKVERVNVSLEERVY